MRLGEEEGVHSNGRIGQRRRADEMRRGRRRQIMAAPTFLVASDHES